MYSKILIYIIIFVSLISVSAQDKTNHFFYLDALNFYSPDSTKSRLDVYMDIPFENISFKKSKNQNNKYSSELDLTLRVTDLTNYIVFEKTYKETIFTEKTDLNYLNKSSQIITKNIFLSPGTYKLNASIKEYNTKKVATREMEIKIKDFLSSPVTISDVMLVSQLEEKNNRKFLTPLVSRNVGVIDTAVMFFYVYLNNTVPYFDINAKIFNSKSEIVDSFHIPIDIKGGLQFDNQIIYPFITSRFANDKYNVQVEVKTNDYTASGSSNFESKFTNYPVDIENIDYAIDQLQYIASEDEISRLEKPKTKVDKQKRFVEFWKSKDPSPNTEKNEVMIEYYKRINHANKNYSTNYTEGWKTDMGMIYIIFGLPSNVERHPYEMDSKPYEIWDYYELNRQFIFVDYTGFGDYRLITPIWETFRFR